jgi:hypothetical protein
MIAGTFHQGSGLGNQLHRYVATRVCALDKGYDWSMMYNPDGSGKPRGFKGSSFMNLDTGLTAGLIWSHLHYRINPNRFQEKKILENGLDIRGYDPEFNFIEDNTLIEGEFQDERYWGHREKEVNEWLKVEPIEIPDDVCVIGFRGGEYSVYPELFLTPEYWAEGIKMMREINPEMKFEVHTDDIILAKQFFPDFKVIHDIGINWRSMRYAKYAIIANSSFYIFPRWLRNGITIAPRYWARHNIGVWALQQNYYSRFNYI